MSKIDTSNWKEFKVSEIFGNCKLGKYHNPDSLVKDENGFPYICASNRNNGINKEMSRVNGNNITLTKGNIISWGKQCPMFTYHDEPCVTAQGMYYIELPEYINESAALFLCSILTKACDGKYSYGNCLIGSKMDEIVIKLPVTEVEEIDWDYMTERIAELERERIAELERERIAELENYLVATGLNDYELTEEDKKVLDTKLTNVEENVQSLTSASGYLKEARKFRITDIFNIKNSKNILKSLVDFSREKYPYVTAQESNNSIMAYVTYDEQYLDKGNCIFIGGKTLTISYQEKDFFSNDSHNLLLYAKGNFSQLTYMYLISTLYKSLQPKYNWNNSISFKKIQKDIFLLPIQTDSNNNPIIDSEHKYHPEGYIPDWEFMEKYIRAIEKVVIKDVVDWKDTMISTMKKVV